MQKLKTSGFRITTTEEKKLTELIEKSGLSKTAYFRQRLLEKDNFIDFLNEKMDNDSQILKETTIEAINVAIQILTEELEQEVKRVSEKFNQILEALDRIEKRQEGRRV